MHRLEALFHAALERPTGQRDAFLEGACPDKSLLQDVRALLSEDADGARKTQDRPSHAGTSLLDHPPTHLAQSLGLDRAAEIAGAPEGIGPYSIVERLGSGGFADVYLAEQKEPVRRRVAIKVLRPGMDSRIVLARFEAERQAMALMEHAGIARVYDAGATERGLPFVVMEYVPGQAITRYCDEKRLGVAARLELMAEVCDAVQHAHQKGVIHRDLKPSNILIREIDGRPHPKIIDFGIAKAISQPLTQRTLITEQGQFVGTPEYMSPEQMTPSGAADVDTRTDVYALGVILYELLTGVLPVEGAELRSRSASEMRTVLAGRDPVTPSTRVRRAADAGRDAAASTAGDRRCASAGELARRVKGDLDWVTMKAIERDRSRRYGTVEAMASDIRRHLGGRTVSAGPPTAGYRFLKFARRNRAAVSAVAGVFLALLAGVVATALALRGAQHARAAADLEAYAANVNLLGSALREQNTSLVRSLLPVLESRSGSWEHRYVEARMEAWLWRVVPDGRRVTAVVAGPGSGGGAGEPVLVVATESGAIYLLDPDTGATLLTKRPRAEGESASGIWALAMDDDATRLLAVDGLGAGAILDSRTLEPLARCDIGTFADAAAYSRMLGAFVLQSRDGRLFRVTEGGAEEILRLGHVVSGLALDDSGRYAAVPGGGHDDGVELIDLKTGEVLELPAEFRGRVATMPGRGVLFDSRDVAGDLSRAVVYSPGERRAVETHVVPQQMGGRMAGSPSGTLAAFAPAYSNRLYAIDFAGGGQTRVVGAHGEHWVFHMAFVTDRLLVSASTDASVCAWDAARAQGSLSLTIPGRYIYGLSCDPSGRRVGVFEGQDRAIVWIDVASGEQSGVWDVSDVSGLTTSAAFLGDDRVVTCTNFGELSVRAAATGRALRTLMERAGSPSSTGPECDVSPNGRWIASPDLRGGVRVWDARTYELTRTLTLDGREPNAVAFSPDSRTLAAGYGQWNVEGAVALWDVETGELNEGPRTFESGVLALKFDPRGQRLAVGGYRGEGWILDVGGPGRTRLTGLGGQLGGQRIYDLWFVDDGARLIAGVEPREVLVWDAATGRRLLSLPGPVKAHETVRVAVTDNGTLITAGGNRVQISQVAGR